METSLDNHEWLRWIGGLLFLLISLPCLAQQLNRVDSLQQAWMDNSLTDTVRMKALDDLIWENHMYGHADSAVTLARTLLTFSMSCPNLRWKGIANNTMGAAFAQNGQGFEALKCYAEAKRIRNEVNDYRGVASTLNNMCLTAKDLGNYASAIEYGEHSLRIYRLLGDSAGISAALANMGIAFHLNGQYAKSLVMYFEALRIGELTNDEGLIANALLNISVVHSDQGNDSAVLAASERLLPLFERTGNARGVAGVLGNMGKALVNLDHWIEAEAMLHQSFAIFDSLGSSMGIALALTNLADLRRKTGRFEQASLDLQRAEKLYEAISEKQLRSSALTSLASTFIAMGQNHRALERARVALSLADEIKSITDQKNAHEVLYKIYQNTERWKEALAEHKAFVAKRDSILSQQNKDDLVRNETEHQYRLKLLTDSLSHVQAIVLKEKDLKRQRQNTSWVIGCGVFALVGSYWIYYADRRRRSSRFDRDAALLESNLLRTQLNPHFINHTLTAINNYIVNEKDSELASDYLVKFSKLMRTVLESSRSETVTLEDDLAALRDYLDLERVRMKYRFDYTMDVDPALDVKKIMVPPLLIQPFVENAIWHGFKNKPGGGHLKLHLASKEDHLVMTLTDNGVGRKPTESEPHKRSASQKRRSFGTAITAERLGLLERKPGQRAGFHYLPSDEGTVVELELPLQRMAGAA